MLIIVEAVLMFVLPTIWLLVLVEEVSVMEIVPLVMPTAIVICCLMDVKST